VALSAGRPGTSIATGENCSMTGRLHAQHRRASAGGNKVIGAKHRRHQGHRRDGMAGRPLLGFCSGDWDDWTDEDLFRALPSTASIRIGRPTQRRAITSSSRRSASLRGLENRLAIGPLHNRGGRRRARRSCHRGIDDNQTGTEWFAARATLPMDTRPRRRSSLQDDDVACWPAVLALAVAASPATAAAFRSSSSDVAAGKSASGQHFRTGPSLC
jgi:hypothetical protein